MGPFLARRFLLSSLPEREHAVAIARRAVASATSPTSAELISANWNTVPVDGDTMIAILGAIVQATITPPPGWTLRTTQDSGSALRMWLYTKLASGEEPGTQWTLSSATKCWLWTGAYSGADYTSIAYNSTSALITPTLAVPANGWLITAGAGRHSAVGSPSSWSTSDGLDAELLDFGSAAGSGQDIAGAVYDSNRALSAGSYARTLTSTNTETTAASIAVALGVASGSTPPPLPSGSGARWGIHI